MNLLKKISVLALAVVFGFAAVGLASAETMDFDESECDTQGYYWYRDTCYETENEKLTAQVTYLTERVTELLDKLEGEQQQEQESATDGETPPVCEGIEFSRSLSRGMRGEDVKCLQAVLNQNLDEPLAETGAGSPGNETSYFGPITERGVVRFQEKHQEDVLAPHGLQRGTGFVGRTTRKKLNSRLRNWKREREQQEQESEELTYCETDQDCILVDTNCCGCEMGGDQRCINEEHEQSWNQELNCNEKEDLVCPAVYLCDSLPSGCKCVNNTCQAVE